MKSWAKSAVVWVNDPKKRRVVVGPFGFAWWSGQKVYIGIFDGQQEQPVSAFRSFSGKTKAFPTKTAPKPAILRFVRTGLLPG